MKKYIQIFQWKLEGKRLLGVDGWTILKRILRKEDENTWIGFMWLSIRNYWAITQVIALLAEKLLASREWVCSTELCNLLFRKLVRAHKSF
jgi:hypothetical protein